MDKQGRDSRLAIVAERQQGAFSLAQARSMGFPRATIYDRVARRVWDKARPGVFVLAGSARTFRRDLWVAVLAAGPGAVVSHESAALLHGAEQLPVSPIALTVPHPGHHRLPGVFAHQIDDLRPRHRTTLAGLPVSTPARSVVELGATQTVGVIGRTADDLVRLRRTTLPQIAVVLSDVTRPGKPGLDKVARVLGERTDQRVPAASELERAMFSAVEAVGLPPPERQVPLPGRGPIRGLADGGYRDAKMLLEADGRSWHMRFEAARRDRERDAQVVRAGWVVLRFVYEQIVHHPADVGAAIAETRAVRLAQLR